MPTTVCFGDGKLLGAAGYSLNVLQNQAEADFSTSSSSFVQVTGSQLIIPAGSWVINYQIELAAESSFANLCQAQIYNVTDTFQIAMANEPLYDTYGWDLKGGCYYATFAASKTLQWQIRRAVGSGPVYARHARIIAIEDV